MAKVPPVFFPAPEMPVLPVFENFESLNVGDSWIGWTLFPDKAREMIRVTEDTAAQGRRSLEIRDDLESWTPHMYKTLMRPKGRQRISFALKVERVPVFNLRYVTRKVSGKGLLDLRSV